MRNPKILMIIICLCFFSACRRNSPSATNTGSPTLTPPIIDHREEARDGFRFPLDYKPGPDGLKFRQETTNGAGIAYHHPGTDFNQPAGKPINWDLGQPVHATANGRIVYASRKYGLVNIRHSWQGRRYWTSSRHMQNIPDNIKEGAYVKKGDIIGEVGDVGAVPGKPHLHFEVRNSRHPFPAEENYGFDCNCGMERVKLMGDLKNIEKWYEEPTQFINTHGPY
jgi:murein DD-endopeptidase MepM/ murein hydrolase activator NlpD